MDACECPSLPTINEIATIGASMNEYEIAGFIGLCLIAIWVASLILSVISQRCWAWIDDAKTSKGNWLLNCLTPNSLQWKSSNGEYWKYYRGTNYKNRVAETDHPDEAYVGLIMAYGAILSILPISLLIAFKFYPIVIGIALFFTIAHLAHYSRRHKKAFDVHVKDTKAHKE